MDTTQDKHDAEVLNADHADRQAHALTIRIHGVWAMLKGWVRLGHVYRAYTSPHAAEVHYFSPFAPRALRGASMVLPSDFCRSLTRDQLLLFLHEVVYHGLDGHGDHTATGLGSGDMATRDATTTTAEANAALVALYAAYDVLAVTHGQ